MVVVVVVYDHEQALSVVTDKSYAVLRMLRKEDMEVL